jgi:hypothetical protein
VQLVQQFLAAGAERFGRAVEVEAVARLVLDLRHEDGLAAQGGRARDPVGFRLHADDLGVGVLRDLADQRRAVGLGHPVAGLDAFVGGHRGVEGALVGVLLAGGGFPAAVPLCAGRPVRGCCRHAVPLDLGLCASHLPTDRSVRAIPW